MHVYKGLNNPDGLVGLSTLRQGAAQRAAPDWRGANHDWILAAQNVGRWSEVETLYEVRMREPVAEARGAVARAADGLGAGAPGARQQQLLGPERTDFLRSLLLAGRPQLLLAVADSWAAGAETRAHAFQAAAAGVAAAWRCGEWGSLDRFLRVCLSCCGLLRVAAGCCGLLHRGPCRGLHAEAVVASALNWSAWLQCMVDRGGTWDVLYRRTSAQFLDQA